MDEIINHENEIFAQEDRPILNTEFVEYLKEALFQSVKMIKHGIYFYHILVTRNIRFQDPDLTTLTPLLKAVISLYDMNKRGILT